VYGRQAASRVAAIGQLHIVAKKRPTTSAAVKRANSLFPTLSVASTTERTAAELLHCRARRITASALRSMSSSVVAHDDTLIRIAVLPCHTVPPHQHVPSS
jgi:hypothetical protein